MGRNNRYEQSEGSEKLFQSSWKEAILKSGLIGLFLFLAMCLILGWKTWMFALGWSVVVFLIFLGRYLFKTPKELRIGEDGITLIKRNGKRNQAPWAKVKRVVLGGISQDFWRIETETGHFVFSDDGFSVTEWETITDEIQRIVKARNIPFEKRAKAKKSDVLSDIMREN